MTDKKSNWDKVIPIEVNGLKISAIRKQDFIPISDAELKKRSDEAIARNSKKA